MNVDINFVSIKVKVDCILIVRVLIVCFKKWFWFEIYGKYLYEKLGWVRVLLLRFLSNISNCNWGVMRVFVVYRKLMLKVILNKKISWMLR